MNLWRDVYVFGKSRDECCLMAFRSPIVLCPSFVR